MKHNLPELKWDEKRKEWVVPKQNNRVELLKFALRDAIRLRADIESRWPPNYAPGSPNAETAKLTEKFIHRRQAELWLENNPTPFPLPPAFLRDKEWIAADRLVKYLSADLAAEMGKYCLSGLEDVAKLAGLPPEIEEQIRKELDRDAKANS